MRGYADKLMLINTNKIKNYLTHFRNIIRMLQGNESRFDKIMIFKSNKEN